MWAAPLHQGNTATANLCLASDALQVVTVSHVGACALHPPQSPLLPTAQDHVDVCNGAVENSFITVLASPAFFCLLLHDGPPRVQYLILRQGGSLSLSASKCEMAGVVAGAASKCEKAGLAAADASTMRDGCE